MEMKETTRAEAKVKINVAMIFIDRYFCSGDTDNLKQARAYINKALTMLEEENK